MSPSSKYIRDRNLAMVVVCTFFFEVHTRHLIHFLLLAFTVAIVFQLPMNTVGIPGEKFKRPIPELHD